MTAYRAARARVTGARMNVEESRGENGTPR